LIFNDIFEFFRDVRKIWYREPINFINIVIVLPI